MRKLLPKTVPVDKKRVVAWGHHHYSDKIEFMNTSLNKTTKRNVEVANNKYKNRMDPLKRYRLNG
jgi:hypothetical protein